MDFLIPYLNPFVFALLAIITVSSYCLISRSWRASKGITAPQAKGAWPIFGHLPLLGASTKPLHVALGTMADKYGPLFTLRLGLQQCLVVSNSEIAKECFTIKDTFLSSRPKLAVIEHMGYNAMFAFAPAGPYWREIRKISTLELLSNRRVELLKHIRVSEVSTCLKEMYKTWSSRASVNSGSEVDQVSVELKKLFGDLNLNVILRMVAGKRYSVATDEEEKKEARLVRKELRQLFEYLGLFLVGDVIPCLRWLDLGGHEKAMKKSAKELDIILGRWVEEHKQKRELDGSAAHNLKREHDFIDTMISKLEAGADLGGFDADTVNKATILALIAGGSDTTTVTVIWAIALLLNNPDKLKRAKDELDTEIGRERFVSDSDTSKLVYIQAIVKETLRLYPAAPLSAPHEFNEDCTIGGYYIPKGTRLITNLWKIQRDPKMWPDDPLEFKPERFLTTHKDVDVRGQHFELIPFGSGRRACPGLAFGMQMVQFILASFLHAFEVSTLSDNTPIDMTESFGLTNMKATPLEVLIKPRLSHKLYG